MARPTLKVEIAFDAGVTGTPTWTDVTAQGKVRVNPGVGADHWRGDEDSQVQRSSCDMTLRNDDGRYTPGNASSPLYPNIKKGRRIRVTSILNGEEFPRFTGYVDDWKAEWPATVGHISDCRISASSRMAYLGRGAELRSTLEEEILGDAPFAYYPLSEASGATTAADVSGNSRSPLVQVGTGSAVVFGGGSGATFAAGKYLTVTAGTHLDFWFNTTTAGLQALLLSDGGLGLVVTAANKLGFQNGVIGVTALSSASINDGLDHHVSWNNTTGETFLDGASLGLAPATFGAGRYVGGDPSGLSSTLTGSIADVAFYGSPLTLTQVQAHYSAGTGFLGDTAAERITRYAAYAGLTAADLALDDGRVADLAHIDITGMTALAAIRAVEETEGGVLFDALDGTLTFHDRARRYEAGAFGTLLFGGGFFGGGPDGTEFTLSYTAGHIASPIVPVLDDQQQVNDMTNTNADGIPGRQYDQASIDDHGLYRAGLTLHTTDPDEPLMRASWTVNRYADPPGRISEVEVNLHNLSDDLAAVVLQAQVGTIFTLADLPDNAPSTTMHLFVEGRSDHITANEDRIIFRTSPVEVSEVFMLDHPDRGLDSGYSLAY
jgi:hypothetical protein